MGIKTTRTKTVTMSELTQNNPTLCLSPLRAFGNCHKCETFHKAKYPKRRSLPCKPRFKPEVKPLLKVKEGLVKQIKEINAKLSKL